MQAAIWSIGLFMLLGGACSRLPVQRGAPLQNGQLSIQHEKNMEYGLVQPAKASKGKTYPLVMYLHGYTEKPLQNIPWQVEALEAIEPCYVFIPTCPESLGGSAWGGTYDADLRPEMAVALGLLDGIVKQHAVDPKRIYVYGGSMGGEGVFMLLTKRPGFFRAAMAVAGYTLDKDAGIMARTPLWILHGSEDTVNATDSSRKIFASIKAAGGTQVRYTEYPGVDHASVWEKVRHEPGLMAWLLGQ